MHGVNKHIRGREVKLINPQHLTWIPVHEQSCYSDSLTDQHHSGILMGTQHFSPWHWATEQTGITAWSHLDRARQIWPHPGVDAAGEEPQQWHLGEGTAPSTHTQLQEQLQTCTRLQIQLPFPKNSHSASPHHRTPKINAVLVHPHYICNWQAAGTLSRFYQPLSVQEITKLTISWELGWSQQLLPCWCSGQVWAFLVKITHIALTKQWLAFKVKMFLKNFGVSHQGF